MKIELTKEEWEFLKDKTSFYLNLVEHDNHQRLINGLKNDYHPDYFNVKNILEKLGSEWKDDE